MRVTHAPPAIQDAANIKCGENIYKEIKAVDDWVKYLRFFEVSCFFFPNKYSQNAANNENNTKESDF